MSLTDIKKLRDMTSLGVNDCKEALSEAKGDFDKALVILRNKGGQTMAKRSSRSAQQGRIDSYIHFGANLGVLVEVNCETDFVARTEVFKTFVKDVAMQIAAASPEYVNKEDIPEKTLSAIRDKEAYCKQVCLMEQPFVKDNKITIFDYLREVVSKTGEKVMVKRFVRFALGEEV
ncbi:MAG: elongation factor Ts [Candidatus Omnitrophica bacterium]|nr:elongation factor Ts [Candidatus Omnitrophota bacterium]MBU2044181.1 elongation factor Ts [Candidatus Omnitrophota bacterium]MBU2251031.1 elongation factor Ts [Candidatus Omnitrophota bacterium]MBU2473513.1 elongation factor Ts [Candidatus Omnitrophota bacterium]